jgi:hypothetical protein
VARPRPRGITALSVFFAFGTAMSLTAAVALLWPGGALEPMWRLNPRAREAFAGMGVWAPLLLAFVSLACGAAAYGLWRGRRWGHRVAVGLLVVHLVADVVNVVLGTEPRAIVGIPVVVLLLVYLATAKVRGYFAGG